MISLLSSPWALRICFTAIFLAAVGFGLEHWKNAAVAVAVAKVRAEYKAAEDQALIEAKASAEEVRKLNEKSRDRILAAASDDARRLRDQFTASLPAQPASTGTAADQQGSDPRGTEDQTRARFEAASEAIAQLSAALKVCGESTGRVAEKLR